MTAWLLSLALVTLGVVAAFRIPLVGRYDQPAPRVPRQRRIRDCGDVKGAWKS